MNCSKSLNFKNISGGGSQPPPGCASSTYYIVHVVRTLFNDPFFFDNLLNRGRCQSRFATTNRFKLDTPALHCTTKNLSVLYSVPI